MGLVKKSEIFLQKIDQKVRIPKNISYQNTKTEPAPVDEFFSKSQSQLAIAELLNLNAGQRGYDHD